MKNIFNKNEKKEVSLKDILDRDILTYLDYMKDIHDISGIRYNSEDKECLSKEYSEAIEYFKSYMESKYPDQVLMDNNSLSINEEEMLDAVPSSAKNLFGPVKYNSLIYINDDKHFAHMHTDGELVIEIEGIHTLHGLNRKLQTPKINSIFTGFSVEEAAAILKQMNLLVQDNGDLVRAIYVNRIRKSIRSLFFRDIIYAILSGGNEQSITRARLFADTYGIDFDFNVFEEKFKTDMTLAKKKDC